MGVEWVGVGVGGVGGTCPRGHREQIVKFNLQQGKMVYYGMGTELF